MEALAHQRDDLRIRQIEIPRGASAVAQQFMIRSVPHLMLYDGTTLISSDTRATLMELSSDE